MLLGGGSGRLHAGAVLHLSLAAVAPLLAIRLQEAVIAPGSNFLQPSAGQISQRIKVATQVAGLGGDFCAHLPRVAWPGPERRLGEAVCADDIRSVGQTHHACPVRRG